MKDRITLGHEADVAETAALNGWGTDPAKRAFYRAFRDFNPLNDFGIE